MNTQINYNNVAGILSTLEIKDKVIVRCNDGEVIVTLKNWCFIGKFGSFVNSTITKVDRAVTNDLTLRLKCLSTCMDIYSKNHGGFNII